MAHLVEEIDDDLLRARLVDPYDAHVEYINEDGQVSGGVAGEALSFFVPFLFGMLLVITIFISSSYLLRSVAEEKSNRVIEIVLSSVTPPATPGRQGSRPGRAGPDANSGLDCISFRPERRPCPAGGDCHPTLCPSGGLRIGFCLLYIGLHRLCRSYGGDRYAGVEYSGEPADFRHLHAYCGRSHDVAGGDPDQPQWNAGTGPLLVPPDRADDHDAAAAACRSAVDRCGGEHSGTVSHDSAGRLVGRESISSGHADVRQTARSLGDRALAETCLSRSGAAA